MDDADLSGMSLGDAKEYVWRHATSLKQTEQDLAACQKDVELWAKRLALATEKGLSDLVAAAQAQLDQAKEKAAGLEAERAELAGLLERLKRNLTGVKARERSVDADLLLAEMDLSLGGDGYGSQAEKAKADAAFASMGVDDELAKLKAQSGGGQAGPAPEGSA
jgi:phage shock protein A